MNLLMHVEKIRQSIVQHFKIHLTFIFFKRNTDIIIKLLENNIYIYIYI